MGNADYTRLFMPANTTVDTEGSKSVLVKSTGHEKVRITVMFSVLADGRKLTPFVIPKKKHLPKENFLLELYLNVMRKDVMTEELMVIWLREVCHRRLDAFLEKREMLVLDALKGLLTEQVKTVACIY
jgi:hypothetical protein